MPESDRNSPVRRGAPEAYWLASRRPLASLVFLLPLMAAYEAGSILFLTDPEGRPQGAIKAERLLHSVFELFGVVGLALPAILLVTVLLVWHVLERRPWKVRFGVLVGMALESVAWTLPLFVMAGLISLLGSSGAGLVQADSSGVLAAMAPSARLTISIGAGLYEELLFRMIGVTVVHALVVDLFGATEQAGRWAAVIVTGLAFAWYHQPGMALLFAYYALAGVFFGWLYLGRGFGITVGTHAAYDVIVLVLLGG